MQIKKPVSGRDPPRLDRLRTASVVHRSWGLLPPSSASLTPHGCSRSACPLALGVMAKLLRLGCPKNDLMGLVTLHPDVQGEDMQWYPARCGCCLVCPNPFHRRALTGPPLFRRIALLSYTLSMCIRVLQWLEGHTQAAKQDFAGAVRTFTQLELRRLPSCCAVLCNLASWLWKQGCLPAAKQAFEKVPALPFSSAREMLRKVQTIYPATLCAGPRGGQSLH